MCSSNHWYDKPDRHEVFGGAYREKSKELGLWVLLCHHEHHIFGRDAVHNNRAKDLELKQEAQRAADGYLRKNTRWNRLWRRIPGPVYAAAGAVAATLCWCMALAL